MRTKSTAIFTTLLCFLLVFLFALSAFADVIWEPYKDNFYDAHRSEITHVARIYTSSSDTPVYKAPDKTDVLRTVPEGEGMNIQSIWTDSTGKQWGCADFGNYVSGWVDMKELKPVYDYISFREEHGDEITACDKVIKLDGSVSFYAYPGAAQPLDIKPYDFGEMSDMSASFEYTSPDGSTWYFCSYFCGHKNIWFTTSPQPTEKPSGAEITTADAQSGVTSGTSASPNTDESVNAVGAAAFPAAQSPEASSDTQTVRTVALILVAALAVGMAVLIPVIMKKKKN